MNNGALFVNDELRIPRNELTVRATRSGGPGGQHVNRSATRVELLWDVRASRAATDEQRLRIMGRLGARLDSGGVLRVVASAHRSQARNRDDAEDRLARLVRRALVVPRPRKPTRPKRSAVEQRLRAKHVRSEKKRARAERVARDFD